MTLALETYEQVPRPGPGRRRPPGRQPLPGHLQSIPPTASPPWNCPPTSSTQVAPYVLNMHIKDFAFTRQEGWVGFNLVGAPLGEGLLDYAAMADASDPKHATSARSSSTGCRGRALREDDLRLEKQWTEHKPRFPKEQVKCQQQPIDRRRHRSRRQDGHAGVEQPAAHRPHRPLQRELPGRPGPRSAPKAGRSPTPTTAVAGRRRRHPGRARTTSWAPCPRDVVPQMQSGAIVLTLDPAAAYAGLLAERDDVVFAVAHPCHPSVFFERTTKEEWADTFGGIAAPQDVVAALETGTEADRAAAETVIRPCTPRWSTCTGSPSSSSPSWSRPWWRRSPA